MDRCWRPAAEVATRIARVLLAETDRPARATRAFPLSGFQEEAVRRARRILARRGGVIVADDVGLGKTYVALALMEEALARGEGVALVVPASLRRTWTPLVRRLGGAERSATGVYVTTHARLSRGTHDAARLGGAGLVVVDEAHAFRNPATRRYRALAARCAGARLVLVTATPVNNGPADLHALVRQFARDDAFADVGVPSLRGALLEAADGPTSGEAARIAREVVVRRTRADLRERAGEPPAGFRFPRRAPTLVLRYDDDTVPALVSSMSGLELAPYQLSDRGGAGAGAEALIRLGLLKRLESGRAAVAASLRRLRSLLTRFADAADRGRLVRPADHPSGPEDGDAVQLSLEEVLLDAAPPGTELPALAASARRDLDLVRGMLRELRGSDPKLEAIRRWVRALAPGEKVVIFSEFRDTAAALWRGLAPLGRVGRVDGGGAWLGGRPAGRRAVVERFAPTASGVPAPSGRERVDILIATDVLSEGLNLQDAGTVVSYDLPWNPVRLLQRIGRVDRLGSPHPLVRPVLFVPGAGLDDVLRLTRRLRQKLGGIATTVGVGDAGELLARLGGTTTGDPLEELAAEHGDPWERLRAALRENAGREEAPRGPPGTGSDMGRSAPVGACSAGSAPSEWLILARVPGEAPVLFIACPDGRVREAGAAEAATLEAALSEVTLPPDGPARADAERGLAAAVRAVGAAVRARAAAVRAPRAMDGRGPGARMSRRLRENVAALGTEPELIRRADAVLARLAAPPDLRTRAALLDLDPAEPDLEKLLGALETVLPEPVASAGRRGPGSGDHGVRVEILGALAVAGGSTIKKGLRAVDEGSDGD